jgi:hypothetical protein
MATHWLQMAAREIEGIPPTHVTAAIRHSMIPDLILANEFEEAIDAGLQGSASMVALREHNEGGHDPLPPDTPLDSLLAEISDDG